MRNGVVVDIDSTTTAIKKSISEAESMAGCHISSCYVGISGSHIQGLNSEGVVPIRDGDVKYADVDRVIETAQAMAIPADQRLLHVLPRDYIIDKQDGIKEPLGMAGSRLEAKVHLVTCSNNASQNIHKCVSACGLDVEAFVLEQLASSYSVLTKDERDLGVCLIDIGGGTTDIAVFTDGSISFTDVIPIAGDHVTNDIAEALRTPPSQAEDIKQQMRERASRIWEVSLDDVDYVDGGVQHKSDTELRLTFKQMAARQNNTGGPIVGRAGVNPGGAGSAIGTHIVDVEVDPDTGKVTILRYTALQDAGKAIHPSYVEGQIQGGVVQGIGWALNEEYFINDQGHMVNSSFLDYRMPVSLDLPMIDTVIVEIANPSHPFGVRGVGEVCIVPPMAAICNAIYNAIGVRLTSLPMNPGKILEAIWEKNGN